MHIRDVELDPHRRTAVMAIVNRTADSFYDPGCGFALDGALDLAATHLAEGADIIDVGAVKGGPGPPVSVEEELDRVVGFVSAFRAHSAAPLSVDTFRAAVARAALQAGADMINDVSGLSEPELADAVAEHPQALLIVMHAGGQRRGRPFRTGYLPDVTTVVCDELRALVAEAGRCGVPAERVVVDPGHDFGKNTYHSLELTRRLPEIAALGHPVLVALSQKDFLGETLDLPVSERREASLAAAAVAVLLGAAIVRTHHTRETVRAVRTVEAIAGRRHPAAPIRGLI